MAVAALQPRASAEPAIEGEGTPEAIWAACATLRRVPRQRLEAWLSSRERLVIVAPHPDDEVLGCGGLAAAHLARGGAALVLAVTNGDASHAGCAEWQPAALAQVRRGESLAGLALLTGPDDQRVQRVDLDLHDGAVADDAHRLAPLLQQHLRQHDVVVTTWQQDGHPDHNATSAAAAAACAAVGCRLLQAPVWLWHWAGCDDPRVPWQRLRGFELDDAAWQRKQQALAAHATQLQPRSTGEGPVLNPHIQQRAQRRCEYFFV